MKSYKNHNAIIKWLLLLSCYFKAKKFVEVFNDLNIDCMHVFRRRGKFRHTLQLNETKSSNDTIAQEKEEVLRTKETDQLIQDKGKCLIDDSFVQSMIK